jgi:hypothetical protein
MRGLFWGAGESKPQEKKKAIEFEGRKGEEREKPKS